MTIKNFTLFSFIFSIITAQTNFTIPQNVWIFSDGQEYKVGNLKGHDGINGWHDFAYKLD